MIDELLFFMEVLVGGLLAGTMYSLVALGFVLIFKASATFNFSQGAMVFFSVLAFCGFMQDFNIPFVLAFILAALLMVFVGLCTERLVLRPLMNASEDTVLMATIGLGYVLEVNNISLAFGGVKAITDTSFNVLEHEVRAIIGPNGAGKSSMLLSLIHI